MINQGDTPYSVRGFQVDHKRLFYSDIKIALKMMVTMVPGYGILKAGMVVGQVSESTSRKSMFVPYAIHAPTAGLDFIGGAYLLADPGSSATTLEITIPDSYKFLVGDHIAGVDNDGVEIDLGAITAIDRTTYSNKATVTVASVDASALDIADGAYIYIQTETTTPFSKAVAILTASVDTGVGANAKGGQASIVLSNAMLYKGMVLNYDSDALTDLGATTSGQYLVLK